MGRKIREDEIKITEWLIEHAQNKESLNGIKIDKETIVTDCECGCASFDFPNDSQSGLDIVSDWYFIDDKMAHNGIFLFLKDGRLGGVEVWSVDGKSDNKELPDVNKLAEVDSEQE